jgi:glutaconate CoA-transferase subunit B
MPGKRLREMTDFTPTEMMIIAASRALTNDDVCFVGIGAPSAACNVARLTHAPDITLIYESGTVGTKPDVLPLSIGDGELCDTALFTVSVPEMFRYWLQGGRITTGFLGGAQIDRFANLNTTVVGPYDHPKVRLPGGGGAPEIASNCGQVFITMALSKRGFVEKLNFITSMGHGEGGDHRARLLEPDALTKELTVVSIHHGVTRQQVTENCGWPIKFADEVIETPIPTETELKTLRDINARTKKAHQGDGKEAA